MPEVFDGWNAVRIMSMPMSNATNDWNDYLGGYSNITYAIDPNYNGPDEICWNDLWLCTNMNITLPASSGVPCEENTHLEADWSGTVYTVNSETGEYDIPVDLAISFSL